MRKVLPVGVQAAAGITLATVVVISAAGLLLAYRPACAQNVNVHTHPDSKVDVSRSAVPASPPKAQYGSKMLNSVSCPSWFHEYAEFHACNRGADGAKYLVHLVDGISGGLGDRLNGALSMLRLAKALDRVLLMRWAKPYDIEEFFEPAGALNWSLKGIPYQQNRVLQFIDGGGWAQPQLHDGSLQGIADTFLTIITNLEINGTCHGCVSMASEWSQEASCLWQSMFSPIPLILQQARAELSRLYPDGGPYAAIHLRLGGLTGEEGIPGVERGKSPLHNLIAGARCATQLAANASIHLHRQPALVVTDNHYLRTALQQGHFGNMVAPAGLPVHLDRAEGQSLEAHRSTIVDMVLLAWAECLVTSRSGYSLHAWLYGGAKPCIKPVTSCL